MNFSELNIKANENTNVLLFNGNEVAVKEYLSSSEIKDLIDVTLQQSYEGGIYNDHLIDVNYTLNLIFLLTDIVFSDEDRADKFELFDKLEGSGFVDAFFNFVKEKNYKNQLSHISHALNAVRIARTHQQESVVALLATMIEELPKNAQAAAEWVNSFDPDKFQAVKDFAVAANGGRPI